MSATPVTAPPARFNFARHLIELNAGRAGKTALIDDQGQLSYGELAGQVQRFAGGLAALGLRREERVLLLAHDSSDWVVAFLGALHAGVVPVAVNTLLPAKDVAYMLGDSRAQAAIVSGINVNRHLIWIYTIAGLLAGIAGTVTAARAISGQSGMGVMYELDAIAAVVIGGTSLVGGKGRITGTVIGVLILGVMTSGFTFIRIDAYYQEMVKGAIIVAAVVADQYRNKKARR